MPSTLSPSRLVAFAFLLGVALRLPLLGYETGDAQIYLLPWYAYAAEHGLGALSAAFTNYTPAYTYLLVAATWFDGWLAPLTLIKAISAPFELGSACLAAILVRDANPESRNAPLAFAAVWLAPSVIHNGAAWGQCDSIWTFFLLLALLGFGRGRPILGVLAVSVSFALKLQAAFLAPFVLALLLRGTIRWTWLALGPLTYLALALPVLLAGRPVSEVLRVYLDQADAFHDLSKGAANLYLLLPNVPYGPGVAAGLIVTSLASLAFAWTVARPRRLTTQTLLLAAAVSLVIVPFLLPKMHERYFYPFEIVILVLACLRPALWPVAVAAQATSLVCRLPFDGFGDLAQRPTGLITLVIVLFLGDLLRTALARGGSLDELIIDRERFLQPVAALCFAFALYLGLRSAATAWMDPTSTWPGEPGDARGLLAFLILALALAMALSLTASRIRRPRPGSATAGS